MTRFHKFLPVRNDISTHTLTWSVTATILHYMENHIFQLTRSRGAWHFASGLTNEQLNFNSHAHVERDYTTGAGTAIVFNFNSHAHVERDCKNHAHQTYLQNISTHTLTWSVTWNVLFLRRRKQISTHTLTWSVTQLIRICFVCCIISTHTLTWSVTYNGCWNRYSI